MILLAVTKTTLFFILFAVNRKAHTLIGLALCLPYIGAVIFTLSSLSAVTSFSKVIHFLDSGGSEGGQLIN